MAFVLPPVTWRFQHFRQKHRKWTSRLPLSTGCFLLALAIFFISRTKTLPKCTKPWFFPSKFCKISLFMKVLKIFNRIKKKHYLARFLPNSTATRMPYLPAKDEFVSLDRLSPQGLWKWYNSKGFGPATMWRGATFHFLAVFSKIKILWRLWLWFSEMFHQRVLSDWK